MPLSNLTAQWIRASRPKTLPLALAGIITAFALAERRAEANVLIFALSALTAIFLQILSNLANDLGDFDKGTDDAKRTDRALASGAISRTAMKNAVILCALASLFCGIGLLVFAFPGTSQAFWGMLAVGCLAILSALNYTLGKRPYGYYGFGDLFVFIFFGLAAVLGTLFLMSHELNLTEFLPAAVIGLMSVAVLNINNLRDLERDLQHSKKTIAVLLGRRRAEIYQWLLYVAAAILWLAYIRVEGILTDCMVFLPMFLMLVRWMKHPARGMDDVGAAPWNALLKAQALGTFAMSLLFLLSSYL